MTYTRYKLILHNVLRKFTSNHEPTGRTAYSIPAPGYVIIDFPKDTLALDYVNLP